MESELLTVEYRIAIEQVGLLVLPDFSVPDEGWKPAEVRVAIQRPDGTILEAMARFDLSHLNIPDPMVPNDRRWRVAMRIFDLAKENVPLGSKILASHDLAAQLLGSMK